MTQLDAVKMWDGNIDKMPGLYVAMYLDAFQRPYYTDFCYLPRTQEGGQDFAIRHVVSRAMAGM